MQMHNSGVGTKEVFIPQLDQKAMEAARRRWDRLTKPPGSLGFLEALATRLAGMTGQVIAPMRRKVIFTVAGDHGVVKEGVSAYPQQVTQQMVLNFLKGGAAINVLGRHVGAEVRVVDAGCIAGIPSGDGLSSCKVRAGTGNLCEEPAMSRQEAQAILEAGRSLFREAHRKEPIHAIGLGDMGIGNTTASAALTAVFTGRPVREVVGLGTGIDPGSLDRKIQVVERALKLHQPHPGDPVGVLAAVGGLEIGCLAGISLEAARHRVPVVLDGFITAAAFLVAHALEPEVVGYGIASHRSVEPGHSAALRHVGLTPLFDLQMRLGEGTGAALGLFLVEASVKLLGQMATFQEAGVSEKEETRP